MRWTNQFIELSVNFYDDAKRADPNYTLILLKWPDKNENEAWWSIANIKPKMYL